MSAIPSSRGGFRLEPEVEESCGELDWHRLRDEAPLVGIAEEAFDRETAAVSVRERQVVHIHPDELVGAGTIETPAELDRIFHRRLAMRQRIGDAVVQHL